MPAHKTLPPPKLSPPKHHKTLCGWNPPSSSSSSPHPRAGGTHSTYSRYITTPVAEIPACLAQPRSHLHATRQTYPQGTSARRAPAAPLLPGAGRVQVRSGLTAAEQRYGAERAVCLGCTPSAGNPAFPCLFPKNDMHPLWCNEAGGMVIAQFPRGNAWLPPSPAPISAPSLLLWEKLQ